MNYKAPDNSLHDIPSAEFAHLLPAGSVAITQVEVDTRAAIATTAAATAAAAAEVVRLADERNLDKFDKRLKGVAIWIAGKLNIPPATAKAEIMAIIQGLP